MKPFFLLFLLGATAGKQNVAIIGSGVGGSSTAYFLREQGVDADVTVFEASERVGGSAYTVEFAGETVDIGGTAISTLNKYVGERTMGLKPASRRSDATQRPQK